MNNLIDSTMWWTITLYKIDISTTCSISKIFKAILPIIKELFCNSYLYVRLIIKSDLFSQLAPICARSSCITNYHQCITFSSSVVTVWEICMYIILLLHSYGRIAEHPLYILPLKEIKSIGVPNFLLCILVHDFKVYKGVWGWIKGCASSISIVYALPNFPCTFRKQIFNLF